MDVQKFYKDFPRAKLFLKQNLGEDFNNIERIIFLRNEIDSSNNNHLVFSCILKDSSERIFEMVESK